MAVLGYWGQNEIMKHYRNPVQHQERKLACMERAIPTDIDGRKIIRKSFSNGLSIRIMGIDSVGTAGDY